MSARSSAGRCSLVGLVSVRACRSSRNRRSKSFLPSQGNRQSAFWLLILLLMFAVCVTSGATLLARFNRILPAVIAYCRFTQPRPLRFVDRHICRAGRLHCFTPLIREYENGQRDRHRQFANDARSNHDALPSLSEYRQCGHRNGSNQYQHYD